MFNLTASAYYYKELGYEPFLSTSQHFDCRYVHIRLYIKKIILLKIIVEIKAREILLDFRPAHNKLLPTN